MKLLSFSYRGRDSWGVVMGDYVADLGGEYPALVDFIASPDFARRDEFVRGRTADIALADIRFLPVIPRPEKIILLVRNYMDHHAEVVAAGLQREISGFPPIFLRVWRSQVGHNEPIIRPKVSHELDWEGELAVIIGRSGRHIAERDVMDHIAGYACYNDASVREWQFHAKQIAAGKNFNGTGPFGPWMVTKDEIADPEALAIETRLNDKVVQSSSTSQLIFKIPRIISYCSDIFDLVPGDVIVTGTPGGVGAARNPPEFLQPGDVTEIDITGVGILRNTVKEG